MEWNYRVRIVLVSNTLVRLRGKSSPWCCLSRVAGRGNDSRALFLDFLFKDGFGPGLEYDGSRSPGDELKELAESVLRVIGSICYDE